jgi:hypothetical protein
MLTGYGTEHDQENSFFCIMAVQVAFDNRLFLHHENNQNNSGSDILHSILTHPDLYGL